MANILQWFPHTTAPFIANAPMFGFADVGLATAVTTAGGFGMITQLGYKHFTDHLQDSLAGALIFDLNLPSFKALILNWQRAILPLV
jgi:NAD(P)H-dependent flavin oxidoreductase YrpB (nitropropane dioxygenase family)